MKKIQYLWHYIPLVIIAIALLIIYVEPWLGLLLLLMVWWLLLPMPIIAIIALIHSFKIGGTHKKAVIVFSGIIVLAFVMFFVVRIPLYRCSPDSMADHYNKKGPEIEELVTFAQSALDEGQTLDIDLESVIVSMFLSKAQREYADSLGMSLAAGAGMDEDEFKFIKKKLKSIRCISIDTRSPEYCDIGYRQVGLGLYSYRVYYSPMNAEQRQEALSDLQFIPYNDRVVFMFGGGAAGPQVFPKEVKEAFLQKHNVAVPE
jgi:hypothetical protein